MSRGVFFLTFDAVIKVLRLEIVAQSAVELGSVRQAVQTLHALTEAPLHGGMEPARR